MAHVPSPECAGSVNKDAQLALHVAVGEDQAPFVHVIESVPVDEIVCVVSQASVQDDPEFVDEVQVPTVSPVPGVGEEQGEAAQTAVGAVQLPLVEQEAVSEPDCRLVPETHATLHVLPDA